MPGHLDYLLRLLPTKTPCNCLSRYKFKKLQHCATGGEPLNPEVLEQWKTQTGLDLHEGYGQTETVGFTAALKLIRPAALHPRTVGRAPGLSLLGSDAVGSLPGHLTWPALTQTLSHLELWP